MFQRQRQPARSVAAAAVLSILAAVAWAALIFGDDSQGRRQLVVLGEDYQDGRLEQLIDAGPKWEKTPQSADWPETRNPLKDFDSDFAGPEKGFPHTTGTADWPFTKNPLRNFDSGFRASWKGWSGPEKNVLAKMPAHYPYLETVKEPDQSDEDYPAWKGPGKEHNIYADYEFPNY